MKPGVLPKLLCYLFVLVICTTSVAVTFAECKTNSELTCDARVAKWGVDIKYNPNSMTARYQGRTEAGVTDTTKVNRFNASAGAEGITVSGSEDVIAPGTWGYINYPTITGTPEVAVKITQDFDLTLTNWELEDGTEYCPLVFKINYGSNTKVNGKKPADKFYCIGSTDLDGNVIEDADDLQAALKNAVTYTSAVYETNTVLDEVDSAGATIRIFWCWPFDKTGNVWGSTALTTGFKETLEDTNLLISNPVNDTYLCNLPADDIENNHPVISYDVSCTVEQID